eukprot:TRINITY_DN13969_c0_g1_i1.p1 TRINITY_DN13969_c0_g1~~TRINITY_DN13969_c0_g1_i1.p1  ORF type:complete len:114 (+),score=19.08 TRINITY_DN13969_c0_g1_i1:132-473(+)
MAVMRVRRHSNVDDATIKLTIGAVIATLGLLAIAAVALAPISGVEATSRSSVIHAKKNAAASADGGSTHMTQPAPRGGGEAKGLKAKLRSNKVKQHLSDDTGAFIWRCACVTC